MITVTVTGKRAEGSTITAMRIVRALRDCGLTVTYRGFSKEATKEIEELLQCDFDRDATEPREVLVCDPGSPET